MLSLCSFKLTNRKWLTLTSFVACFFIAFAVEKFEPGSIGKDRWKFLINVVETNEIFVRRGPLTQTEYKHMVDIIDKGFSTIVDHYSENKEGDLTEEQVKKAVTYFTSLVAEMKERVNEFAVLVNMEKLETEKEQTLSKLQKVIDCKVFMRDLVAQTSWLDIYTYAEVTSTEEAFKNLGKIFEVSSNQSKELDEAILKHVYSEHKTNRAGLAKRKEWTENKAVVAGAGMSGLYATLQFFRAGMEVVLVNDRSEEYERALIVGFDLKWREQMRFFLGTQYDRIFDKVKPVGRLSLNASSIWISLRELEKALKDRLRTLEKFLEQFAAEELKKTKNKKLITPKPLQLFFKTEVTAIQFPTKKAPFYQAATSKTSLPLSQNSQELNNETSTAPEFIPFNILVCAGGASDRMRDTYIGIPKAATIEKSYTRAVLQKGSKIGEADILKEKKEQFPVKKAMNEMDKQLHEQNFEQLVSKFSDRIKTKYYDITKQMLKNDGEKKMLFGLFENVDNQRNLYVLGEAPSVLGDLVDDIDAEAKQMKLEKHDGTQITELKKQIERKYLTAVLNTLMPEKEWISKAGDTKEEQEEKINFNLKDRLNTSIFKIANFIVDEPAKRYVVKDQSAIVLAVGDALANNHFFNGAGFSTARMGAERAAAVIGNAEHSIEVIEQELIRELKLVQKIVVDTSAVFLERRSKEDQNKLATKTMCDLVNKLIKNRMQRIKLSPVTKNRVITPNEPQFIISVDGRKGRSAKVTEDGRIMFGGVSYSSPIHAAVSSFAAPNPKKQRKPNKKKV